MPLLNDELSLWEIAHRWNNLDPNKIHWFGLPLEVRDSFRLMMNAILNADLVSSLSMDKWHPGANSPPEFYIRYYIDDIYACIWGHQFNRKLFKFVSIDRWCLQKWCEMYNIPLPEFWFPPSWKIESDRFMDDYSEENDVESKGQDNVSESAEDKKSKLRNNQKTRIVCQQIAEILWKENPHLNIADMVKHEVIQKYGGSHYEDDTVRSWIKDLAPSDIKGKRGRPKKK